MCNIYHMVETDIFVNDLDIYQVLFVNNILNCCCSSYCKKVNDLVALIDLFSFPNSCK